MNENEIKNVTQNMFSFLRIIKSKLFRPLETAIKCNVSPLQFHILGMLNEKTSMTMTELANDMLISKQQLTPMIDKLIDGNFVVRENDKDDRRIIKISLTDEGRELLQAQTNEVLDILRKKFESVNSEELKKLDAAFKQIYDIMVKLD